MKKELIALSLAALMAGCGSSAPKPETAPAAAPAQNCFKVREALENEDVRASYALGYEIGVAFRSLDTKRIDVDAFVQGVLDTLQGKPSLIPIDSTYAIKKAFFDRIQQDMAAAELEKGAAFRAEWQKAHPEAVVSKSGLLYRVVQPSASAKKPVEGDEVAVHYVGKLADGSTFDSSKERGTPFMFKLQPGTVIEGWNEILPLMNEGMKVEAVIPPELGYGDRNMRVIPPNSTLVFEIELLKVNPDSAQVEALVKGQPLPPDQPAVADSAAAPAADTAKVEAKPAEAKKDAKAEAKPAEAKKDAKAEAKPAEAKKDVKAEAKPAEAKKEAKAEAKPAEAKKDAKAEAKPAEAKKDVKAEAKPAEVKKEVAPAKAEAKKPEAAPAKK